jgi:hypothetical protein
VVGFRAAPSFQSAILESSKPTPLQTRAIIASVADVEFTALDKSCSSELHEATLIEVRLKSSGVSSIN